MHVTNVVRCVWIKRKGEVNLKLKIELDESCRVYAGTEKLNIQPLEAYSEIVCDFLDELSISLRKNVEAARYPDIKTFAFWCRRGNIQKLKNKFLNGGVYMGRGLAFHITPSNVPINFAFSLAFGLLSGNANIVRIPSKEYVQMFLVCDVIRKLWQKKKYSILAKQNLVLSYDWKGEMTKTISEYCNIRVIWGGDETINRIRRCPIQPRAIELVFADRYSFGIIDCETLNKSSEEELQRLAEGVYNDTYAMDQNACSTPHMMFFLQGDKVDNEKARSRFWNAVYEVAANRYELEDIKVSDKYVELCKIAVNQPTCLLALKMENLLYVVEVPKLEACGITEYRGQFGLFYQHGIESLDEIVPYIESKVQSVMYYGVVKEDIKDLLKENHLMGIDRIVPFGRALNMGVFWDGYDIITQMSRVIDMQ